MRIEYELLGQPCNPVNRSDIYLEISHDQESVINQPKPHVGINNLFFAREDIQKVMAYLQNAPSITEGVPFDIKITEQGLTHVINMYLNLMDGFSRSNDGISASVKMLQSLDWLDDKVDGFTFESMYNELSVTPFSIDGIIYNSYQEYFDKRCIYVPYVISTVPNFREAFMALFSMTYIIVQLKQAIKQLIQWCTPMAGTPSVGVGQVVLEIIFFALMLASLIALIIHLFDCLIQAIKYHGAMLLIDMLKVTAIKLGLNFNSSIWNTYPYNQIAYLPEKYNPLEEQNPNANTIFGVTFGGFAKRGFTSPGYATPSLHDSTTTSIQKGYLNGTGGDLLRLVKRICNGKIIIPDQTNNLILERRDYYPSSSSYQLPDIRQDWNGYNTDELTANILIRFEDDLNDKNCIDKYIGTIFRATHQQIITTNQALVLLKGIREIQIGAARGVRKEKLNLIENIHKDLYAAFHVIANAGIIAINAAIVVMNAFIVVINAFITVFNILVNVIMVIVNIIKSIISAISALFGGSFNPPSFNWTPLNSNWVNFIAPIALLPVNPSSYTERIDALLIESDMVSTPKLLLVDIARAEFNAPGGYSGKKRIAYLHADNSKIINAQYLWDNFYSIDAFVGSNHNRYTKISPALNKDSDKNPITVTLSDFRQLVSNPKISDNFGEEIIADSIQWYIEKNGEANIEFRKKGWLINPQSTIGTERAKEININLQIKTSLPNGQ